MRNPFDERAITAVALATERWYAAKLHRSTNEAKHMSHQQPAGVSRRWIVKGGVYALTGIAIASLTRAGISAAEAKLADAVKEGTAKNVIQIFLPGGMAAQESFDPKVYSPVEYRGPLGSVETSISK